MSTPTSQRDTPAFAGSPLGDPPGPEFRELMVFVDERADNTWTVEFAAKLAEEHDSRLTGVFVRTSLLFDPSETFARGEAVREVVESSRARIEQAEAERRAQFERAVGRRGVRSEWRAVDPAPASELASQARYADLALVAREDPSEPLVAPPGLVESLVLTSGRPVVVLPSRCLIPRVRRILIGWNAQRQAVRAVAAALPLLVRAEAVEVLVVDPEPAASGHGQEPGADIAWHLARHNVVVDVRQQASDGEDVGRVLLSRAAVFDADLVVMGAYGHSRLSRWAFGGVTRTALQQAVRPLFMCA